MFPAEALQSADKKQTIKELVPTFTKVQPKLDGVLNDEAWKNGPIVDDIFITYNPLDGDILPQKTAVYMAYDADNLYFAFYCYDTEPDKIKTSITKHDNAWNDDWVGFAIDTCNSKQFAYEFFMNPSGMQADILNSAATGEDSSPDYIWFSAGKVVSDGYIVEMRMPLKNFRFNSGEDVEMNIMFWRRINRLGMSGSWPEIKPGESIMSAMSKVRYGKLDSQLVLELLPAVTYSTIWDRQSPDKWSDPDDATEFGITGKYGITSSITAEFTINPDFSQVESDSFQVLTNQRYPIFYSEKRPFFMEAGNIFSMAGTSQGDPNLWTIFHTRRIVDPDWGLKLSGEIGNFAFGLVGAGDEWPGRIYSDEEIEDDGPNPLEGEQALYLGGRLKYSLGRGNFIGAVYTGKELGAGYNRVVGGDFQVRTDGHSFKGYFLNSSSKDYETKEETDGSAWALMWNYSSQALGINAWWEHMDEGFQMDTAYYRRSGIDKYTSYFGPNIYPAEDSGLGWIKRFNPFLWGYYVHDLETGENDYFYLAGLRTYFSSNAWLRFDYRAFSEYWEGEQLEGSYFYSQGYTRWTKWFEFYVEFYTGDGPYYNDENPQVGNRSSFSADITIQPNGNFTQDLAYTYVIMNSQIDDEKLYDVNIFRSRTTYQFDKYLFLRAVLQWDSNREIFLSDILLSYQLNPQTVFHLGYGSLHENLTWRGNEWQDPNALAQYYQTTQSIFFKASYLIKF